MSATRPPEGARAAAAAAAADAGTPLHPAVLFEQREGIATLTLNEGDRLNPLTPALQQGVLDALRRVRDDKSIRALILTAAGRAFCVGADLADFSERAKDPSRGSLGTQVGHMLDETGNPMVAELRSLPVPVVCAVNGVAAGGGVGLALAADVVVAARSAYFYLPFVPALGAVPDMGASWALPRAVGRARALGLALLGEKLDASRAADWGLVWACVDDAVLAEEAQTLATRLAAMPTHAVAEARALFAASERNNLAQQLALERERQAELIDGEAFAEGMRAFIERRPPVFRGRG
jgi:2-(1,2-epoxy-1,2-dihydrophenyl)acetyl-CoA isomerase